MHDATWRAAVAKYLELVEPIPDQEWAPMRDSVHYRDAEQHPTDIEALACHYEVLRENFGKHARPRQTRKGTGDLSKARADSDIEAVGVDALAELVARYASGSSEVIEIRLQWGGALLTHEQASDWLESHSDKELIERCKKDRALARDLIGTAISKKAPPKPMTHAEFRRTLDRLATLLEGCEKLTPPKLEPSTKPLGTVLANLPPLSSDPVLDLPRLEPAQRKQVMEYSHRLARDLKSDRVLMVGVVVLASAESGVRAYPYYQKRGTLGLLSKNIDAIAKRYRWNPNEALAFVLQGTTPRIRGNFGMTVEVERSDVAPALNRIVMSVDPAASPKAVRDAFAVQRAKLLPHHRKLSAKHETLALFVGDDDFNTGKSWTERMQIWNAGRSANRDWEYANVAVFQRDALVARKRILGSHPTKRGEQ